MGDLMPKFIVTGTNYWGNIKAYLHKTLEDLQAPTPFMTQDIKGNTLYSRMSGEHYNPPKEVELKKGDYIMLITNDVFKKDNHHDFGHMICGHMHYYDGKNLLSVYTKKAWEPPQIESRF
jgi:hypothetical protein